MFTIGDKISHPMHGAGIIEDITYSVVDKKQTAFYVAKMICGAMTVLIPCDNCEKIGVRNILSKNEANTLVKTFAGIPCSFDNNWNRRLRENSAKAQSGDLKLVYQVVKSLYFADKAKPLSTGERKLFNTAKIILVSELMLSMSKTMQEVEDILMLSFCDEDYNHGE